MFAGLALFGSTFNLQAAAQQAENDRPGDLQSDAPSKPSPMGSPEDEMMARNAIKLSEQIRKETLNRARDAADIAASLRQHFQSQKALGNSEVKQLERLEKLTRKLRGDLGGEDAPVEIVDYPTNLEEGLKYLEKNTSELREGVEKTPRHVISTALIDCTNKVLDVVRYVRKKISP